MVMAEAQACGCPVIGPDVVGINEVVRPEFGGVLYPFDLDASSLAALIEATLKDDDKMRWRRQAAATFARETFGLERMVNQYVKLYEEALQVKRKGGISQWIAPVLHWQQYIERRWTAGQNLFAAAEALASRGDRDLSRLVAKHSFETCPSLFLRPHRLLNLLKIAFNAY